MRGVPNRVEGYPLPPSISLIASIHAGFRDCECTKSVQNLDVKELRAWASGQVPEPGRNAISAYRLGLDDDRVIAIEDARLDVTRGCGKRLG